MQLLKEGTVIDFLGKRFYAGIFSAILLVGGVVSILMHQGLNYGIDLSLIHISEPTRPY